jgi:hypothetical protein
MLFVFLGGAVALVALMGPLEELGLVVLFVFSAMTLACAAIVLPAYWRAPT